MLSDLFEQTTYNTVKNCAIAAIVTIGYSERGLEAYEEWARPDSQELRGLTISGFGDLVRGRPPRSGWSPRALNPVL